MDFYGKFKFHPIGQGLFYSGFLLDQNNEQQFSIVYDCGSETKEKNRYIFLETEITQFLAENQRITNNGEKLIDLLVISHFDEDHINGLEYLLNNCKINRVVMPYFNLNTLRILQVYSKAEGNSFYLRFIQNPYNFLNGKVKEIIFAKNDDDDLGNIGFRSEEFRDEMNQKINIEIEGAQTIRNSFKTFSGVFKLYVNKSWTFSFFNKKADNIKINEYNNEINSMVDKTGVRFEDLLKDINQLKKLKKKLPFKTSNLNSVLCFHYKSSYGRANRMLCDYHYRTYFNANSHFKYIEGATLLTGDLNDPSVKDVIDITDWINSFRQKIGVFLVPHHGAQNTKMPHYSFSSVTVISFGIRNRHKHPTGQVLKEIAKSMTHLACVHEYKEYCYIVVKY